MHSIVQPNAWVALKLPTGNLRVLQVTPNTTISLGKYGTFPSNLIINRPFHLTYELLDRREDESFTRLRIVPASELYSDILAESSSSNANAETDSPAAEDDDAEPAIPAGIEYSLVDPDSGAIVARTDRVDLDASARQTLTMEEIEALKKDSTSAGKDLIAKLMLSHTALDQKTEYSLAKYKLLKTKKYIRRFSVLPIDVPLLDHWLLEEKDATKILDMREEMLGLLGCWANVHCSVAEEDETKKEEDNKAETKPEEDVNMDEQVKVEESDKIPEDGSTPKDPAGGRWLVVDDTGCLLVAAMAERMGVLYPPGAQNDAAQGLPKRPNSPLAKRKDIPMEDVASKEEENGDAESIKKEGEDTSAPIIPQSAEGKTPASTENSQEAGKGNKKPHHPQHHNRQKDLDVPFKTTNTITLIHNNSQPNASFLRYFDFDIANPSPSHPLSHHLLTLSWLQLLHPTLDSTYAQPIPSASADELRSWKANRRGTYHRKRRRWARVRHTVDSTRGGGFSGLVVASTMDPISILRHAVPLLAGGAPVAIYSQAVEPLTRLMDCYSIARRAAWVSDPSSPANAVNTENNNAEMSPEDLERWQGNDEFPLNPSLLLGASLQTSRARKWQVLPGRTHPLMTSRGGAEGYVFTAWRVRPAEGRVEARGKARSRKRKVEEVLKEEEDEKVVKEEE